MKTSKDWEILITAITKSVIESGAAPDEWESRIRKGLSIVISLHTHAMNKEAANAPADRNRTCCP